jgi:hypothetical protein
MGAYLEDTVAIGDRAKGKGGKYRREFHVFTQESQR